MDPWCRFFTRENIPADAHGVLAPGVGHCQHPPLESGYCVAHNGLKCCVCGRQAQHMCYSVRRDFPCTEVVCEDCGRCRACRAELKEIVTPLAAAEAEELWGPRGEEGEALSGIRDDKPDT